MKDLQNDTEWDCWKIGPDIFILWNGDFVQLPMTSGTVQRGADHDARWRTVACGEDAFAGAYIAHEAVYTAKGGEGIVVGARQLVVNLTVSEDEGV